MSVERKKKVARSSSSNCRMRSRRLLRIRTEKINTTNFWRGYAGVRTTSAGNSSPQFEKNRQLALARKRSALLRIKSSLNNNKSGDQTSSGVSYSVKRRPLAALPDFLKQALPTKSSSNTKNSSTSKQPTIGGGVRDVWGADIRNAAEFASTMSYALGALSTLSTQATAQKAEAARVAFNKEVAASGVAAPAGRVVGCKRRRQSQRKLQEVDKGAQIPPQSLEESDTNSTNDEYHDPRRSVVGSLSTSLSRYCSSMCHTIAKQTVTGGTSGRTFRSALLTVVGTSSKATATRASSSSTATTTSTVLHPSTIASRLASVNALLEAFEFISVLQRRVQSRRTKGSMNSSGTTTIKPCSRDFTSKALVYTRRNSNKRMSIKDSL